MSGGSWKWKFFRIAYIAIFLPIYNTDFRVFVKRDHCTARQMHSITIPIVFYRTSLSKHQIIKSGRHVSNDLAKSEQKDDITVFHMTWLILQQVFPQF